MADDELPEGSRKVLEKCFQQFDKSGDGILQAKELPQALQFAGIFVTVQGAKEIAQLFDKYGDGKLQIKELVDNWKILAQHSVNGDDLLNAFKVIDKNKDGFVRLAELKHVLTQLGEKWTSDEARQAISDLRKYDTNNDGKFSYPEFVQMYINDAYPFKRPSDPERKDITQDYDKITQEGVPEEPAATPAEWKCDVIVTVAITL